MLLGAVDMARRTVKLDLENSSQTALRLSFAESFSAQERIIVGVGLMLLQCVTALACFWPWG